GGGSLAAWRRAPAWLSSSPEPAACGLAPGPAKPQAAGVPKKNRRSLRTGGGVSPAERAVEEALELAAADGVLQLAHRLGLDLADALARHLEDPAHLLQRVGVAVAQAVAQLDDLALAVGQRLEHLLDLVLEHLLRRRLHRRLDAVVLDEVAEVAVLALAHRAVQADRVPADLQHPPRLLDRDARLLGRLLDGRLPA